MCDVYLMLPARIISYRSLHLLKLTLSWKECLETVLLTTTNDQRIQNIEVFKAHILRQRREKNDDRETERNIEKISRNGQKLGDIIPTDEPIIGSIVVANSQSHRCP
jgi:hypothetical protein